MKTSMKYVIIGNSAAAIGAVEGIRQVDKTGEITLISDELYHTYSRPLISYLLLGKATEESMKYRPDSFYEENKCKLLHGKAEKISAEIKCVVLADGSMISYDKLLVATGSSAFVPPFEGLDAVKDKYTFMNLDDARALDAALVPKPGSLGKLDKKVLIIGAGLIGLKCAEGIMNKAGSITVLDLAPRILSSILDEDGAVIVQKHLESKGLIFKLSSSVKKFKSGTDGSNVTYKVTGKGIQAGSAPGAGYCAVLENGEEIDFDILVLAVGVRPNTSLLKGIAEIDRGIVINEKSETTAPDIYAAGDCTQSVDVSSGQNKIMALLPNAYMQGECAGINMAGGGKVFDKAIPMNAIGFCCGSSSDETSGSPKGETSGSPLGETLHIITAGNYIGDVYCGSNSNDSGTNSASGGKYNENNTVTYKRLFYSDNKLNGYILIGNVEKAGIYTSLIREQTPLDTIDFPLICEKPGLMAFSKEDRETKLGTRNG